MMSWEQFCSSLAESAATRTAWAEAQRIKETLVVGPFKQRGEVERSSSLGIRLSKPYTALTEDEFLHRFKLLTCLFGLVSGMHAMTCHALFSLS